MRKGLPDVWRECRVNADGPPYYHNPRYDVVVSQRGKSRTWISRWNIWRDGKVVAGPFESLEAAKLAVYLGAI